MSIPSISNQSSSAPTFIQNINEMTGAGFKVVKVSMNIFNDQAENLFGEIQFPDLSIEQLQTDYRHVIGKLAKIDSSKYDCKFTIEGHREEGGKLHVWTRNLAVVKLRAC